MTEKICEEMMETFLSLDQGECYPLRLTLHLLGCGKCRAQTRLLSRAEAILAAPLARPIPHREALALAEKIAASFTPEPESSPISLRRWIASGLGMIAAMILFALAAPRSAGNFLHLAFYLVFGGAVTAYCAIFIAGNMDFLVKKMESALTFQTHRG